MYEYQAGVITNHCYLDLEDNFEQCMSEY